MTSGQNAFITEETIEGADDGPLVGKTVAVKDNISTEGVRTTCGSKMLEDYVPPYDATVVGRLKDAGATIVGKANMDEFGMGSTTETSAYGPTLNPVDESRVPGGSSGGSAAAVAAGSADLALGTDTGGSVRNPASFCGVVGIKPTYGLVSRYGLVAYANSLEQIGPLAPSVGEAAALLDVISGHDDRDATSRTEGDESDYAAAADGDVDGLTVGVPTELLDGADEGVVEAFWGAIETLESQGASYEEVTLPSVEHGVEAYYVIAMSEASSNLARFDGVRYGLSASEASGGPRNPSSFGSPETQSVSEDSEDEGNESSGGSGGYDVRESSDEDSRADRTSSESGRGNWNETFAKAREEGFGDEVKRRILLGTYALSAGYHDKYYKKAQDARAWVKQDFDAALSEVDVLASPTMPTTAFERGESLGDPLQMYLADANTVPVNLANLPAISVPAGESDGLPVGVQFIGSAFDEEAIIRTASAVEN